MSLCMLLCMLFGHLYRSALTWCKRFIENLNCKRYPVFIPMQVIGSNLINTLPQHSQLMQRTCWAQWHILQVLLWYILFVYRMVGYFIMSSLTIHSFLSTCICIDLSPCLLWIFFYTYVVCYLILFDFTPWLAFSSFSGYVYDVCKLVLMS